MILYEELNEEENAEENDEDIFLMPVKGVITSAFNDTSNRTSPHKGVDIAVPNGTQIFAAHNGVVEEAAFSPSYGNYIIIDHQNGCKTIYAHNSSLCVQKGDVVKSGQLIALSGSTGDSTGPHLHFELIKNGVNINPVEICK